MAIKLVIDIGNTLAKIAVYRDDELVDTIVVKSNITSFISGLTEQYGLPVACIISSVKGETDELVNSLLSIGLTKVIVIRSGLRLPLKIAYRTPESLGSDRLANACGAWKEFPGKNVLVIDLGTCIKYDLVTEDASYHGGSISPGLKMRYKALSSFTGQLPYFKPVKEFPGLLGQSTEASMRSGVENGILAELDGIISRYQALFDPIITLFTGGDHARFADKVKSPIFVAPNLTLNGLKVILDHNDL